MALDLKKVLSISGQPGLFEYIAPSRTGFIVESMSSKPRSAVPTTAKVTTLADVSIYADDGEVTLRTVLEAMRDKLEGKAAMSSKSDAGQIKDRCIPADDHGNSIPGPFQVSGRRCLTDLHAFSSKGTCSQQLIAKDGFHDDTRPESYKIKDF